MRSEEKGKFLAMPCDYEVLFYKAELTFQYQMIYDSENNCLAHLNDIDQGLKESLLADWAFLGPTLDTEIASGIARGSLDPVTWKSFEQPLPMPHTDLITSASSERENTTSKPLLLAIGSDSRISLKRNYATAINTTCKSYAERVKSHQSTQASRVAPPLTEHLQHIPSYLLKAVKPRKNKEILPTNQTSILDHINQKTCI